MATFLFFLHHQLIDLPVSPISYSLCTLGNPTSRFSTILFTHDSDHLHYLRLKWSATVTVQRIIITVYLYPVYTMQPVVQPAVGCTVTVRLYNRLFNRFINRLYLVNWVLLSLGQYYQDVLLMQQELLHFAAISGVTGAMFVFHQDSALAIRARDTVELLRWDTQFISPDMWPSNSCDLNLVDYWIWGMMQKRVYTKYQSAICMSCSSGLLRHGLNFRTAWWMIRLISGEKHWKHVSVQMVVTLNTCCDVACLTFKLPHNTTGSFHSHQCHTTQLTFSEPPKFREKQYTFHHTNESAFHKVVQHGFLQVWWASS